MGFINVEHVSKQFDKKSVLENVSFEIQKGEILGLIGPNGAGKTTLINIMLGLLQADQGNVFFDGKTMQKNEIEIKQKIGYIPQELALMENCSCWSNLEYFATLYNLHGKERKEACEAALKLAKLEDEKKKKVSKLSGGMKRRLNIACGTMHKPELIILDEPTVGVDPQSRNFIFEHLLEMNRKDGCTILYTSHYMEEVEKLCDRIFILDEGKEIAFGDKESIRGLVEEGRMVEILLHEVAKEDCLQALKNAQGVKNIDKNEFTLTLHIDPVQFALTQVIKILEDNGNSAQSISYKQVSLEQVFLELTGKELRG